MSASTWACSMGPMMAAGAVNFGPDPADRRTVTVASTPVATTLEPARLFLADHGAKLLRYCGVSVVNVITGQALLAFCLEILEFGGVVSQLVAAMVSAVPAYVLSRRWVWKQTGRDSFRTEVLPFWIIAIIGLVFAVSSIAVVEQFTDRTILLMLTSLTAYGVVWIGKYIVLDRVMWKSHPDAA